MPILVHLYPGHTPEATQFSSFFLCSAGVFTAFTPDPNPPEVSTLLRGSKICFCFVLFCGARGLCLSQTSCLPAENFKPSS